MEETKIICISCPKGCPITIKHEGREIRDISGFTCANGETYATNEFTAPVRVLTSTVRVKGGELPLLPVKTKDPIPKETMFDIMKEICEIQVEAPVQIGTVLKSDLCGTGVDLVACRSLSRASPS